jgi:type VI secretion system secreted protein VgrG
MNAIDATVELPGVPLRLQRMVVREGASLVRMVRARVLLEQDVPWDEHVGRRVVVTLSSHGVAVRSIRLLLVQASFAGVDRGLFEYDLDLSAPLWRLGLGVSTRKFCHASVRDIVSSVLAEASIDCRWAVTQALPVLPYTVQYRESSLSFVTRLLGSEGIYFICDDDGELELHDRSCAAAPIDGPWPLALVEGRGALADDTPALHAITAVAVAAPRKATVADRDWKRPGVTHRYTAAETDNSPLESYDYPGGFRSEGEGLRRARLRLELLRATAERFEGRSSVMAFAPGRCFALVTHADRLFDGEHFLYDVEHRVSYAAGDATYANRFRSVRASVPFRPPMAIVSVALPSVAGDPVDLGDAVVEVDPGFESETLETSSGGAAVAHDHAGAAVSASRPRIGGFHVATVVGPDGAEVHTDAQGRFKARLPWDRETGDLAEASRWIRMLQEISTSQFVPRVGWEVVIGYIDGDPDRPVGIGRLINGTMPPSHAQPARKTVTAIRTPSSPATGGYHEILFDDQAGAQRFEGRAELDLQNHVKHDRRERIGNDEVHRIGRLLTRDIGQDQTETIEGNRTVEIGGQERLIVERDRTRNVGGSEHVEIAEGADFHVNGDDVERVAKSRLTVAGSTGSGSIMRRLVAGFGRSVGGSQVSIAGSSFELRADHTMEETVGGNRTAITLLGSNAQTIDRDLDVAVGGSDIVSAKTVANDAPESAIGAAGDMVLHTPQKLVVKGRTVIISAGSRLVVEGPDSWLGLAPADMVLSGKLTVDTKGKGEMVMTGNPVNLGGLKKPWWAFWRE